MLGAMEMIRVEGRLDKAMEGLEEEPSEMETTRRIP